jgi:hypothetical protein
MAHADRAVNEGAKMLALHLPWEYSPSRSMVSNRLETHQSDLTRSLERDFESEFPRWTKNLGTMLSSFEDWLARASRDHLTELSIRANIRVGRVFDRNWELLSPILPVWMIRRFVHRHFVRTFRTRSFRISAGSARSGKRASTMRCGELIKKPRGASTN